jgi:PleD family two-component response regulator
MLSINILNLHHYQKTQRLALIDGLPGLYNKDIFMEFLRKDTMKNKSTGLAMPYIVSSAVEKTG